MEIVLKPMDTLSRTADTIALKTREMICNPREDYTEVKLSLDLTHPVIVEIEIMSADNCDDLDACYCYRDNGNVISRTAIEAVNDQTGTETSEFLRYWLKDVDDMLGRNREKEDFEQKCYEAYQLDWMISHGHSLNDLYMVMIEYMRDMFDPEDFSEKDFDEDDIDRAMMQARDILLYERGMGNGNIFVCKDEFLGAEFKDPDYMDHLLNMMPDKNGKKMFYYTHYMEGKAIS